MKTKLLLYKIWIDSLKLFFYRLQWKQSGQCSQVKWMMPPSDLGLHRIFKQCSIPSNHEKDWTSCENTTLFQSILRCIIAGNSVGSFGILEERSKLEGLSKPLGFIQMTLTKQFERERLRSRQQVKSILQSRNFVLSHCVLFVSEEPHTP